MSSQTQFERPHFDDALKEWKKVLAERGFPTECVWIFSENLCFERDPELQEGFRVGFQLKFTPPPPDADRLAYGYFSDFDCRLVFYRIGSCHGKSVCALLCDKWFDKRGENDGFIQRDPWLIAFRPGEAHQVEEIYDEMRWRNRVLRDRPLHDLDFCLPVRAVHEILAHGRVLTSYEHYALRFLHLWERLFKKHG